MWGDIRIDPWFYAMLLVGLSSCTLFFTKAKWAFALYAAVPIIWLLRQGYENAINEYLISSVPIRLDWPLVVMVAVFPVIPVVFHGARMIRRQTQMKSSHQTLEDIGA